MAETDNLFVSVDADSGEVVIHSGDAYSGLVVSLHPEDAMELVTSILDASKAGGSILTPDQPVWGTVQNRFLNPEHSDSVQARVIVYSGH